jgi:hypothetical protein
MVRHGPDKAPACPGTAAMQSPRAGAPPRSPGRLEIVQAIPPGSRRARSQRAFLAALGADPELPALRADARRTVMELARLWARHADWRSMTSWRPRALMCAEVGSSRDPSRPLSVTAYRAARAWLQRHGYLGLVSQGWTSALRASALDDGTRVSAVFVLAIPRQRPGATPRLGDGPVNRALSQPGGLVVDTHERAREARTGNPEPPEGAPSGRPDPVPRMVSHPLTSKKQIRSEGLAVAAVVLDRARVLRPMSREHVASVIRPFVAAGWLPGDILRAVDFGPDDQARRFSQEVRHPAGWLRHRLASWLSESGPLRSPSQLRAADRDRVRTEQSARRAERLRAAERPVDVAGHAARARALLRQRG